MEKKAKVKMYDVSFIQPSTFLIVGATASGKTTLVNKILKHKNVLFDNPPSFVVYCYSQKQTSYEDLYKQGLIDKLIEGFPGYQEIKEILTPYKNVGSILVLDDGLSGLNQDITRIFYELSHRR